MNQNTFIRQYILANYPVIAIETFEDAGILQLIESELPVLRNKDRYTLTSINCNGDFYEHSGNARKAKGSEKSSYDEAFEYAKKNKRVILVVYDYQFMIGTPGFIRRIKNAIDSMIANNSIIILVAPSWHLPQELIHEVTVVSHPLPSYSEVNALVTESVEADTTKELVELCTKAAMGLTQNEILNSVALSRLGEPIGIPKPDVIENEKMRLIKSATGLEVWLPRNLEEVGGLKELKEYLLNEVKPNESDKQISVRGLLFAGVSGCAKSLSAKVIASVLKLPIIRMDISGMKGGLVGQSETNVKNALKLVDAIAPVVIVWDEIEKAIGGYKSSSMTDSGVTLGIVGQLLTWMQERKSATFIVATTNDVTAIPPEMMRRFDEQFFFDFPTLQEREEIARIHLELLNCNVDVARMVAENTAEWTGAEIEKLIKSAARRTKRKITGGAIVDAQRYIKPISVVRKEEVDKLCEWGRKSLRIANG